MYFDTPSYSMAELAQSVERTTLNRVVVGSIPTFGDFLAHTGCHHVPTGSSILVYFC